MSTVQEVVAALRSLPTNSDRGTKFEELMVRYFHTHPVLSSKYDEVYRWTDWKYNGGRGDTGIDLVAHSPEDDSWTAIQCKFYEPTTSLQKSHIDSFFTESGRTFQTPDGPKAFSNRVIISTTDRWSSNAEDALNDQVVPVQRIGLADIADAPIDWDIVYPGAGKLPKFEIKEREHYEPRPHQAEAIEKVMAGFTTHDRGKLIMACGTGKTFTSLRLAEQIAENNGGRARVLFCVPSISLLSQTLREWMGNATMDVYPSAVCSDSKVSRATEDIATYDLEIPVTTDGEILAKELNQGGKRGKGLHVVFTTYQSLPAVHAAQKAGASDFDLVICDEAHRTTGVTLAGEDASNFVKIHDASYIKAAKRLYMTATPRLFDDSVKSKASDRSAELTSMDDETIFGPEFHRLGFGDAVERDLLTDYKVLVLAVDEDAAAASLQKSVANSDNEITLDDASKIIGCWNALAKRSGTNADGTTDFDDDTAPMQRAVAFAKDIKASKQIAEMFPVIIEQHTDSLREKAAFKPEINTLNLDLQVHADHVDGTMNALERGQKLNELKAPLTENEARILTNARCLSEGVDVPSLDAVLFLNPRNSVVDVVQSVGRVMRLAEGKDYGYIVLPVAVPAGMSPSQALSDNTRFRVVWQILNALRAHDDRFNAMVNSVALNATSEDKTPSTPPYSESDLQKKLRLDLIGNGDTESPDKETREAQTKQMALFSLDEWQEALYTRIVDKVGDRAYWSDWADDVADIANAQIARINALLNDADGHLADEFSIFLDGLRGNLNDSISEQDAVSMLSQHMITAPIFDALFSEHDFAKRNPVSQVMQRMIDALGDQHLDAETAKLDKFYESVRVRASEVTSAAGKQKVIKDLYERFFRKAFKKQSEALGIVYTPVEIVDFIIRAADDVMKKHFNRSLSDENVNILDPFTGTGTFMVRLLQSGRIKPEDMARKYANEMFATEIMLLAYYVAAVNIETTYNAIVEEHARLQAVEEGEESSEETEYQPFENIVLADTFQAYEEDDQLDLEVFKDNNARLERQKNTPMTVIIGNPPYSVGQTSANDLNANLKYPTLDGRIEETYAKLSTATNKNSLYDSYLRAFRWATDRIKGDGVVAFVSNGGWIDGNTADGVRKSFANDFSDIYLFNLRGNQRTAGELSRKEGGKVFGSGSRNTVAILIGIKDPDKAGCEIHYRDIGDYLSAEEKLDIVNSSIIENLNWTKISPNTHGDWINQRSDSFGTWPTLADRKGNATATFFNVHSRGLSTARDAWCYSFSNQKLQKNLSTLVQNYNECRTKFHQRITGNNIENPKVEDVDNFLRENPNYSNPKSISWNVTLKTSILKNREIITNPSQSRISLYRPFTKQSAHFNPDLNDRTYQLAPMFPTPNHWNIGIGICSASNRTPFSAIAVEHIPNLGLFMDPVQLFTRWTWKKKESHQSEPQLGFTFADTHTSPEVVDGYRRVDNITDEIHTIYTEALGADVTKDDIFYFVYGQLHDPNYRETYAADLKKMLPHIETPTSRARFDQLSTAGRELMDLHINYEDVEPWPVKVTVKNSADEADRETWRVTKMKWKRVRNPETKKLEDDRSAIIYNSKVTIENIPLEADEYMLGSRSALAWIIDRYQVKTDKASGIVNDPNDWADEVGNPKYIVDLIGKVTRVAMETNRIVESLNDGL